MLPFVHKGINTEQEGQITKKANDVCERCLTKCHVGFSPLNKMARIEVWFLLFT
jgi:hypothetical protein